jgi:hypothetical protein
MCIILAIGGGISKTKWSCHILILIIGSNAERRDPEREREGERKEEQQNKEIRKRRIKKRR